MISFSDVASMRGYVDMNLFQAMDRVCPDLALASFERDVAPEHPCPDAVINIRPLRIVCHSSGRMVLHVGIPGTISYEWQAYRWVRLW